MAFKSIINHKYYSIFATIVSAVLAIFNLVGFVSVLINNPGGDFNILIDAIFYLISFAFYAFIAYSFYRARFNFYFAYSAIFSLILCNYILPLIQQFIISGGILFLLSIFSLIVGGLAVAYFVLMVLENKKRSKKYLTALKVVGIIFAIVCLGYGIYYTYFLAILIDFSNINLSMLGSIVDLISVIFEMVFMPIIFGLYPFLLSKIRYEY